MTPIQIGQVWQGENDPRKLLVRPYEDTPGDLAALTWARNETLRPVTLAEDFQEIGPEEMGHFYNRGDFTLAGNAWLVFHGEEPAGAAVVYPPAYFHDRQPGNFDIYVAPRYARHGLGSRLLDHLQEAARERGHPVLETTIPAEDSFSTRFLSKRGFQVVGQTIRMARNNMENLPTVQVPEGFTIRSLQELGEGPELYVETANRLGAADPNYSLIRLEELQATMDGGRWEPEGILFMLDPLGRIIEVIRGSGSGSGKGYLHEIRLEPAYRGRGLGIAILAAALAYLKDTGVGRVELDTAGTNTPAHHLALRAGFAVTRHYLSFLKRLSDQLE